MDTAALQVRSAAGSGFVANNDGVERNLSILKDFSAPGAVDSVYEKVASFLRFKRTDQTLDAISWRSICYAKKRGPRCIWVGVSPNHLRRSCGREKSLELARVQGGLGFLEVPKQIRRLFGPRGRAARRGVLVAADADMSIASGKGSEAWVAYGKAEGQSDRKWKRGKGSRMSKDKVKG